MVMVSFQFGIDAKDRDGKTSLHQAVMNLSLEIVRPLLVMGAAPNIAKWFMENHLDTLLPNLGTMILLVTSLPSWWFVGQKDVSKVLSAAPAPMFIGKISLLIRLPLLILLLHIHCHLRTWEFSPKSVA